MTAGFYKLPMVLQVPRQFEHALGYMGLGQATFSQRTLLLTWYVTYTLSWLLPAAAGKIL